jgi:hypothetical protein
MNLERQVKMMEQQDFDSQEDLGTGGKVKNWIQDNIRIIISVLIVVAIAGGIYSYSNRGQAPSEEELALEEEFNMENQEEGSSEEGSQEGDTEAEQEEEEQQDQEEQVEPESEDVKVDTQEQKEDTQEDSQPTSDSISQETEDAFIETAVAGDSRTTLARKALKSYLEKNQDSELTPEHKIYIEDYLRKNVDYAGGVNIGSQMTFSKNLIKDAVEKSKTLNENQLENLKKYSAMVSNL